MKELINALEKLVGFITGIAIGVLMVVVVGLIGIGIDIDKSYPGGLDDFLKDGIDNWERLGNNRRDTEGNEKN